MSDLSTPFLPYLADRIAERPSQEWRFTLVILPSKRAALHLKELLFERAGGAFIHPLILTSESWALELTGARRIEPAEELRWLYEAYRQTHAPNPESFDAYLKWASLFLSDLNEADRYLCPLEELYRFTRDVKILERWELHPDPEQNSHLVKNYLRFWERLGDTQQAYHQGCIAQNALPQGLAYRKAAEEFNALWPAWKAKHKVDRIYIAGLNALNKAEEQLFRQLMQQESAEMLFDLPKVLQQAEQEAGQFIRRYQSWGGQQQRISEAVEERHFTLCKAPGDMAQLQLAADLLQQLIQQEGLGVLQRTALVLADEQWLLPMLSALPPEVQQVNVTMGLPLVHHPLTALVDRWMQIIKEAAKGKIRTQMLKDSLLAIHQLNQQSLFDLSLLPQRSQLSKEEWKRFWHNYPEFAPILEDDALHASLALVAWLNQRATSSINQMALKAIQEALQEVKKLETAEGDRPFQQIEQVFRLMMRDARLDFQGEPLEGLQIMGILESRSLEFDYLICTSVNEGILPKGRPVNSLFPPEVRKTYALPDHGEKDSIYGYHFLRLLARSKRSWLIYSEGGEGISASEPSRFLLQVQLEWPQYYPEHLRVDHLQAVMPARPDASQGIIPKTERHLQELKRMAERGFSPSALSLYLSDPIAFFLRYLSGVKEPQRLRSMDAAGFGSVFHKGMELLLAPLSGQTLQPAALKEQRAKIPELLTQACALEQVATDDLQGQAGLAFDMIKELMERSLEQDIQAASQHAVQLLLQEEVLMAELAPGIAIRGKSDRIDRVDGVLRIVDYKTGSVDRSTLSINISKPIRESIMDGNHAQAFQLLCYALMLQSRFPGELLRASIFLTREWSKGPADLLIDKKAGIPEAFLAEFAEHLKELIEEILDPAVPFAERTTVDSEDE